MTISYTSLGLEIIRTGHQIGGDYGNTMSVIGLTMLQLGTGIRVPADRNANDDETPEQEEVPQDD